MEELAREKEYDQLGTSFKLWNLIIEGEESDSFGTDNDESEQSRVDELPKDNYLSKDKQTDDYGSDKFENEGKQIYFINYKFIM